MGFIRLGVDKAYVLVGNFFGEFITVKGTTYVHENFSALARQSYRNAFSVVKGVRFKLIT